MELNAIIDRMDTLLERETYIPDSSDKETNAHNEVAIELYIDRIVAALLRLGLVDNYEDTHIDEYSNFHSDSPEFISEWLFLSGCSLQHINDDIFATLISTDFEMFDFLENNLCEVVNSLSSTRLGEIFSYLISDFLVQQDQDDTNGIRRGRIFGLSN